jgi:hypothetical protein
VTAVAVSSPAGLASAAVSAVPVTPMVDTSSPIRTACASARRSTSGYASAEEASNSARAARSPRPGPAGTGKNAMIELAPGY